MKEEKKPCEEVLTSQNEDKKDSQQWWESVTCADARQESER